MLSKNCEVKRLIEQYQALKEQMKTRVADLANSYQTNQPLNQYLAILQDDPELEELDQKLCELENLLPDSEEYDTCI